MEWVQVESTAFAHRDGNYFVSIINVWLDQQENPGVNQAWTEDPWTKIRHEGEGVYVNFPENEGEHRLRGAYPSETYDRLAR